jgi:hypothetical protein
MYHKDYIYNTTTLLATIMTMIQTFDIGIHAVLAVLISNISIWKYGRSLYIKLDTPKKHIDIPM